MPAPMRTSGALALAALALAGCGDAGPAVREPSRAFTVRLDDYLIRPQRIRVPKGGRLTITVVNHGRLGHTFRIRGPNHVAFKLTTLKPGERRTRTVKLAAGNYTMFCALANHEELGMSGRLTVG